VWAEKSNAIDARGGAFVSPETTSHLSVKQCNWQHAILVKVGRYVCFLNLIVSCPSSLSSSFLHCPLLHFTSENGIPLPPQTRRSRRRIPHLLPPILYPRRLTQPARRHSSRNRCLDLLPSLPSCLSRDDHPTSAHAQHCQFLHLYHPRSPPHYEWPHRRIPRQRRQDWARGPWSGDLVDGRIHGRGAVDMKAGTAASVIAYSFLYRYRHLLSGSLALCAVSDEETGGKWGCKYLLELDGGGKATA
jgi:hypothetical protein